MDLKAFSPPQSVRPLWSMQSILLKTLFVCLKQKNVKNAFIFEGYRPLSTLLHRATLQSMLMFLFLMFELASQPAYESESLRMRVEGCTVQQSINRFSLNTYTLMFKTN